jgi:hypothetical protein
VRAVAGDRIEAKRQERLQHCGVAPEALARWAREHHLAGVSFEAFIFTRPLRDALRGAGLRISVGAINSIEQLEPVLPMAPDVLVSDRPHELREEWRELSASR